MAAASRFFAHEQRGAQAGGRRPSWLPPREVWSRIQDWKLLVGAHKHGWDNSLDLLDDPQLGLGALFAPISTPAGAAAR